MTARVWVDGRAADPRAAHVSALDRGLTLGDGLFETVRVYGGRPFRLGAHLARLRDGCRAMRIDPPAQLDEMAAAAIDEASTGGTHDARLRLTITRGAGAAGLAPTPGAVPTVIVAIHPLPPRTAPDERAYACGIQAHIANGRINERSATAGLKTLAYADAVLALAEAHDAGADDALRLDTSGHLAAGSASNLFLVLGGVVLTPPVSCGILPGITRRAVLDRARSSGIPAEERTLEPRDLARADEAFLTSSVREIVPLVRVDGADVGSGRPGPITRRLMEAYAALVRAECGA